MRKVILLSYQNNYVERSNKLLEYQHLLQHCLLFLRFQQNYFDDAIKLSVLFRSVFSKILDSSTKLFFPCRYYLIIDRGLLQFLFSDF